MGIPIVTQFGIHILIFKERPALFFLKFNQEIKRLYRPKLAYYDSIYTYFYMQSSH